MTTSSSHNGAPRRRWLSMVWMLGVAALAFSLAGAGWMMRTNAGPSSSGVSPSGSGAAPLYCIGHVDVENGVSFPYPATPGRVVKVEVHEGDSVKKDAVLFRMDDRIWQAQKLDVKLAETNLAAAKLKLEEADIAKAKHKKLVEAQGHALTAAERAAEAAGIAYQEKLRLVGIKALLKPEADAAEKLRDQAEAVAKAEKTKGEALEKDAERIDLQKKAAEEEVAGKTFLLEKARLAVEESVVRAPADGKILRLDLRQGDLLGVEPKTPPLIFCPDAPRIVRAEVEQEWAGRVQEGQIATILDDTSSGNGPSWTGKVIRVSDWMAHRRSTLPDPTQFHDIRTLECIIAVDPNQPPLRIGQRVRVALANP